MQKSIISVRRNIVKNMSARLDTWRVSLLVFTR